MPDEEAKPLGAIDANAQQREEADVASAKRPGNRRARRTAARAERRSVRAKVKEDGQTPPYAQMRHGIGANFPPEAIDDSAQYDSSPPEPTSTRRRGRPPEPLGDIPSPLLSVPATQRYLGGLSLTVLYDKMRLGELEVCKLGGRRFITLRSCNDLIERNCSRSLGDALAIERAKKAARESVRVRKEKKRLVPGKLRTRAARHAARASNEGGADTQGNAIPAPGTLKLKPASRQRRKSER